MAVQLTQTALLTTLAYLMGERTVNSTTSAPRADFIQETLNEAYSAYPWRFARATATLTVTNGIATLPTNYDDNQVSQVWMNGLDPVKLNPIDADDQDVPQNGDREAWIESIDGDRYKVVTLDTDVTQIGFRYQKQAPILDSAGTVTTPYPKKMTIALGARRYVKLGQNPDSDISQDEDIFSKRLTNDIAAHQVPAPRKKRRQVGGNTGDF